MPLNPGQTKSDQPFTAFSLVLALELSALIAMPVDGSCGTESCPLDLASVQPLTSDLLGTLSLHVNFECIKQDVPRLGSEKVAFQQVRRPDHDEIRTLTQSVNLRGSFTVSPVWSFDLTVPFIRREHSHIAIAGHHGDDVPDDEHVDGKRMASVPAQDHEHDAGKTATGDDHTNGEGAQTLETWRYTEFGDITAWTRMRLHGGKSEYTQLTASLGLTLPTATTRVRNSAGTLAEPSLQPGSGGFGVLAELSSRGVLTLPFISPDRQSYWYASARLRLNRSGDYGYRFGHETVSHVGLRVPLSRRLVALSQVGCRWRGEDGSGRTGELVDATGGIYAYLSPGLQLELIDGMSLYGYYQLPLYQHVNDVQITSDRNLLVGIGYSLYWPR